MMLDKEEREGVDYLVCPICGTRTKNLIAHIRRTHDNSIKSRKDFEERFPNLVGKKLQISIHKKDKEYICPYCGKVYNGLGYLQLHIKFRHPEKFARYDRGYKLPTQICPICNKELGNLRQHVRESHDLEWNDFCIKYNWDSNKAKIVTKEYRENLSQNKRKFYRSERGLEYKKIQSQRWIENNPSHLNSCLEKLIFNRSSRGHCLAPIGGIKGIKFQFNQKTFRSYNEFKFYILCLKYNLDVQYEPKEYCIKWYNGKFNTTYLPDFYIQDYGVIELKNSKHSRECAKNKEKYIIANKTFNSIGIKFSIHSIDTFFEDIGINIDFQDNAYVKNFIQQNKEEINIISPYRHSQILKWIFDVDDLSIVPNIKFTKTKYHNLYGEL